MATKTVTLTSLKAGQDLILTEVGHAREDLAGVNTRLDCLNGRVRHCETDIAALNERTTAPIPIDRLPGGGGDEEPPFRWTRKHTGVSVGVGGAVLTVIELIQHLAKLP